MKLIFKKTLEVAVAGHDAETRADITKYIKERATLYPEAWEQPLKSKNALFNGLGCDVWLHVKENYPLTPYDYFLRQSVSYNTDHTQVDVRLLVAESINGKGKYHFEGRTSRWVCEHFDTFDNYKITRKPGVVKNRIEFTA